MTDATITEPAAFQGPLDLRRIEDTSHDGRGTWLLLARLTYWSALARILIQVPAGFINDLASVPRIPFVWLIAGGIGHAAAVVHDWLYSTHQTSRKAADAIFHEALLVLGVAPWRAWAMWATVRAFGGSSWDSPGQPQPPHVQAEIDVFLRAASSELDPEEEATSVAESPDRA